MALEEINLPNDLTSVQKQAIMIKACITFLLLLGDEVLEEVLGEKTINKLGKASHHMIKSLHNHLCLKK